MGKSFVRIVTLGAAIAVNVVPGIGQAISGAIVGGLGGTFAALGVAQAVVGALTLGLTVAGLQSAVGLLGLGPSLPKPDTAETAIKTSRPPRVSAYGRSRLYGAYVLYESASGTTGSFFEGEGGGQAVDVFAVHDGELDAVEQFYLNDDKITLAGNIVNELPDKRYGRSAIKLYHTTGQPTETAFAAVVAAMGSSRWTNDHRGDGVVSMAQICEPVKAKHFLDVYPNGVPVPSMVARWQKCPDPHAADPTDESGWTWTENPIRQLMHYKLVREGVDYATKIAPTIQFWRNAADICDEAVPLKAGGTEPRYRSEAMHKHTDAPGAVVSLILSTCDGWISPRADGALVVYAGKYDAPTISIGPEQIVAYEWNGVGVDDDEAVNEIVASYLSADHDYNTVECDPWLDEADISARGEVLSQSMELPVPSHGQARRLAKRVAIRANALYRGTVTTNIAGRVVMGHRFVNLELTEAGTTFFNGAAEIIAVTRNIQTGGVTFTWRAADPNIDAWNPIEEEGEPAALGERAPIVAVIPPIFDAVTPELTDDALSASIRISVFGPVRDDLTWFARWKLAADTAWIETTFSDIAGTSPVELIIGPVPVNASIDVQAAYALADGRFSEWNATENVSTSTDAIPPGPVTNFTATGDVGEALLEWRNPNSINFSQANIYRNTVNDFGTASFVASTVGALGADQFYVDNPLAPDTYYWWITTENATAAEGPPTGPESDTVT